MQYMGSKRRLAKHIVTIIKSLRKDGQTYVEPFVGGGNLIEKIDGNRIGSDINPDCIQALCDIRDNVEQLPRTNAEFTEEDYKKLRVTHDYRFRSYAGFAFSWGGKWLGGWARNSKNRDYVATAFHSAMKQSPLLQGVTFLCCSYDDLVVPDESFIYCDPPYKGTTSYRHYFDNSKFFDWCVCMHDKGHTVLVSEYFAPDTRFRCVWEGSIVNGLVKDGDKRVARERLFLVQ